MDAFGRQPILQSFAVRSFEFHQHLAFDQIDAHALRLDLGRALESRGQFFRPLTSEAGQRVQREVARHRLSTPLFDARLSVKVTLPGIPKTGTPRPGPYGVASNSFALVSNSCRNCSTEVPCEKR